MAAVKVQLVFLLVCVACVSIADACWPKTPPASPTGPSCSYVSRAQWGAKPPTGVLTNLNNPVTNYIIHHTDGQRCSTRNRCDQLLRNIQHDHQHVRPDKFDDIGYNWLVDDEGRVYEGRGWDKQGAHTRGHNSDSIGICLMGTFNSNTQPTAKALQAIKDLMVCGVNKKKVKTLYNVGGHCNFANKDCPGSSVYEKLRYWPRYNHAARWCDQYNK